MKIFGYEIRKAQEKRSLDPYYGGVSWGSFGSYTSSKALTLSACYRAINLTGDAIASLQMKTYKIDSEGYKTIDFNNPLYSLLGVEPNSLMSRFNFFKMIISSLLLRGNAYVKINRDIKFNVLSLELLNPDFVQISTVGGDIKYAINGIKGLVNSSDMIHILNYPQFGSLYGVSTITYAANTLEIAYNSEEHAKSFFEGGGNAAGFLGMSNPLTPKQENDINNKIKNNPNGLVIMGGVPDLKLQTLGVSPKDAQLLESRQFNVLDIARFFNINPILLFDNTKATYNNIENAQLDFLNTTLLPIIEKLENEFTRKLILPSQRINTEIRFDVANLLRADSNSRATYFKALFEMGVISPNQIAKELDLPKIEGVNGSEHFISTNLQQLNKLIVNQNNSVDNKLK